MRSRGLLGLALAGLLLAPALLGAAERAPTTREKQAAQPGPFKPAVVLRVEALDELFALQPDIRYAEFHERALFNHILGSMDTDDGATCYMVPVGSGVGSSISFSGCPFSTTAQARMAVSSGLTGDA